MKLCQFGHNNGNEIDLEDHQLLVLEEQLKNTEADRLAEVANREQKIRSILVALEPLQERLMVSLEPNGIGGELEARRRVKERQREVAQILGEAEVIQSELEQLGLPVDAANCSEFVEALRVVQRSIQ